MSEAEQVAEANEAVATEQPTEAVENTDPPAAPPRDWDGEASKMGWIPEDKFKGDPGRWTDAETFVRKGEDFLPFIKAQKRDLEKKTQTLEEKVAASDKQMAEMAKYLNKAEETGYNKAVDEYKAQQKAAFAEGDDDKFEEASEKLEKLYKEQPKKVVEVEEAPPEQAIDPDLTAWHQTNQWYDTDPKMTAYALSMSSYLQSTRPDIKSNAEFYNAVTDLVKREFPDKFGNPKQRAPSDVVEAPSGAKPTGNKRSFEKLPPDAKAACERFMAASDNPEAVKAGYVANWDWG